MTEPLLDAREVARLLAVPLSWVYAAAAAGEIPSVKVGHYRRFKCEEIEAWLAGRREGAMTPGAAR